MKGLVLQKFSLAVSSAVLLSSLAASIQAQPVVVGASGKWSSGETFVISGSGFGGTGPNVVLFDNFESGSPGSVIGSATYGSWIGDTRNIYTSDDGYSGSKSMIAETYPNLKSNITAGKKGSGPHGLETFQEVFFTSAIKDLGNMPGAGGTPTSYGTDSNSKDMWLMLGHRGDNTDKPGMGNDMYIVAHTGGGHGIVSGNNGGIRWFVGIDDYWQFKAWNRHSFYAKADPSDPYGKGIAKLSVINGKGNFLRSRSSGLITQKSGVIPFWDRVKFAGWYRWGSDMHRVMDDIYMAIGPGAQARVEVCDKPTYEQCTMAGILVPTSWQSGRIQATYYGSPISNPSDAYLYVFDSNGTYNSSGYPLHGLEAATATKAPPSPPSDIQVVPM